MSDRLPPQAVDAERAILGSMMIEKEAAPKVMDILTVEDFYSAKHKKIYRAMMDLWINNEPVDSVTLAQAIKKTGETALADIGGAEYVTGLINEVKTAANVEHYARIVKDKATLRRIAEVGTNMVDSGLKEMAEPREVLEKAEDAIFKLSEDNAARGFTKPDKLVHPMLEMIENLKLNKADVPGLRTGYAQLDKMTGGLQDANLIIVAGRPSMGKTSLGLNIAEHVAVNDGGDVAIFSLEMSKEELIMRLACSVGHVDSHKARLGYVGDKSWPALTTAASKLMDAQIHIDDSANLTAIDIRTRSRKLATEIRAQGRRLKLVVIDYIQLMRGYGRHENRQQEMSDISRSLKALARDLRLPVVALSQLSRKPEEKGREGRPQLSDLRESGALEQDADVVALLYREGYYKRNDPTLERTATLILAKQRNGPIGDIPLTFIREWTRFENEEKLNV